MHSTGQFQHCTYDIVYTSNYTVSCCELLPQRLPIQAFVIISAGRAGRTTPAIVAT